MVQQDRAGGQTPGRRGTAVVVAGSVLALGLVACTTAVDAGTADPSRALRSSSPSASPDAAARSQAVLNRILKADEPGCTAAVGRRGRVVWTGSNGLADVEAGERLTPDTLMRIGSVSKQFTATAVLLLQQRGQLALDDRLSQHLDGLPSWSKRVTLAQLMHMSSGVPEVLDVLGTTLDDGTAISGSQVRTAIRRKMPTLDFAPGTQWAYSNTNYYLLAEVVERRSGRTFDDFLDREILAPLGLTFYAESDPRRPADAESYRYDAVNEVEPYRWDVDATGAGGLRTTPSELVRWADNYRTGRLGGSKLLREQVRGAPTTLGTSNPSSSEVYGAGIFKTSDNRLIHGGSYAGFVTYFVVSADRSTAVALACNLEDVDIENVGETVAEPWL